MSKKSTLTLILSGFLLLFSNRSNAQDGYSVVTSDFELWSKAGIKYDFNDKWGVSLDQAWRLRQNASLTDQVFTNVAFTWKPIKTFKFGLNFRYIYDRGGNLAFDHDFRVHLDASYKQKFDRLSIIYRLRYQNRNELGISVAEGDDFQNDLRFRTKLEYNIKNWKLDPHFSTEIFRDLTRYEGSFNQVRLTLGTDYKFDKIGEIGAFYRIERELGISYPKTTYIIGLNYTFHLKKRTP